MRCANPRRFRHRSRKGYRGQELPWERVPSNVPPNLARAGSAAHASSGSPCHGSRAVAEDGRTPLDDTFPQRTPAPLPRTLLDEQAGPPATRLSRRCRPIWRPTSRLTNQRRPHRIRGHGGPHAVPDSFQAGLPAARKAATANKRSPRRGSLDHAELKVPNATLTPGRIPRQGNNILGAPHKSAPTYTAGGIVRGRMALSRLVSSCAARPGPLATCTNAR